jgi:hypothetical protein
MKYTKRLWAVQEVTNEKFRYNYWGIIIVAWGFNKKVRSNGETHSDSGQYRK